MMSTGSTIVAALAVLGIGCRGEAAERGVTPAPAPVRQEAKMQSTTLTWRGYTPAGAGVSLDVIDGVTVGEGDIGSFHYVSQTRPPIHLDLWIGPEISLAWWRGRFGSRAPTLGAESTITVCGRAGTRQEVSVPAQRATGARRGDDGAIGHVESKTGSEVHVALAATTASGAPFVVAWRIAADQRAALRADEAHFLSSIRCP